MPWEELPGDALPARTVADGLERVLRLLDAPGPATVGNLFENWDELVGDEMAEHARPLRLKGTTLVVGVDDAGWATQLRWLSHTLLDKLSGGLGPGVVTDLEVQVQPPVTGP